MNKLLRHALAILAFAPLSATAADTAPAPQPTKPIVVGFAQTGAESAWRVANTGSLKDEADKRGINLKFVDGQSKQENQLRAVRSFISQHVDAIVIAPIVETGWDLVLRDAKRANIPVIIMDRTVQAPDDLYTCYIGSDFYEEGRMAIDWIAQHAGDRVKIVEIQGEPGSAAANERHKAFVDALVKYPQFKVIDAQTANFRLAEGKQVMEALLKKHNNDIQIVFAHNDDMALGALQAIEEAGLKPGKDIMVVSIDATKAGIQAVADGRMNCVVECNPMYGPKIYDTIDKILKGESVPKKSYNKDQLFDATNAAAALPTRQY